jgi:hypothetical protein
MSARLHGINNHRAGTTARTLASRMVASPELRCSRHAEDSSYALPSRDGGEPVAPSCGRILDGPRAGKRVFFEGDDADLAGWSEVQTLGAGILRMLPLGHYVDTQFSVEEIPSICPLSSRRRR